MYIREGDSTIAFQKEFEKEEKVASVHDEGGVIVVPPQMTVGEGKAGAASDADVQEPTGNGRDNDADDHLTQLEDGNVHGLECFGFAINGHEKVVTVHDGMDGVVHDAKYEGLGGPDNIRVPAVEEDRYVMVPMEENEWFLVNDNKKGVKEFRYLGEGKELNPQSGTAVAKVLFAVGAKVFVKGIVRPNVHESGGRTEKTNTGKEGETQIPCGHGLTPIPRWTCCKVLCAKVNEQGVDCDCENRNPWIASHEIIDRG